VRKLADDIEFLRALKASLIQESNFQCEPELSAVLRNPRFIIAPNHATPLSWIAVMCELADQAMLAGGGDLVARGVADRWFYSNPFTKAIAEYLTQFDRPLEFEELIEFLKDAERTALVIFPEGANSFFGNVNEIQPFRSTKFIELSIRCQAPILLTVHKGSEGWSIPLPIPKEIGDAILPYSRFFGEKLQQLQALNWPLWPQKVQKFSMVCRLYMPALYEGDLAEDPLLRRQQLANEAEEIRLLMEEMRVPL
jgi:1-acyl-sn-glycerol-3-phosphate acyltransferase